MNEAAQASGLVYGMMFHQRMYRKYCRLRICCKAASLVRCSG